MKQNTQKYGMKAKIGINPRIFYMCMLKCFGTSFKPCICKVRTSQGRVSLNFYKLKSNFKKDITQLFLVAAYHYNSITFGATKEIHVSFDMYSDKMYFRYTIVSQVKPTSITCIHFRDK